MIPKSVNWLVVVVAIIVLVSVPVFKKSTLGRVSPFIAPPAYIVAPHLGKGNTKMGKENNKKPIKKYPKYKTQMKKQEDGHGTYFH